ncbi:hypothetical protein A3K73_06415 [Candidatus Pacearchaeota archaeon RBG_13_36_9]|nr:MAG: hypothetical protein A3K73_06415 [Candidatus Pacearchaeota archaeon RBG_13_36_9]
MEKKVSKKKMRKSIRKKIVNPSIEVEYSSIDILTGSDLSKRKLPFMHIKSISSGPVIWLTACVHGDEVGGMVVIQEVFKKLKKEILKGEVYAFPLMNPIGFENYSRKITFSNEDLNRSFPGNENGSLAERIAYQIFTQIKDTNPSLVLDLHNDWRKSIPYVLLDPKPGKEEAYEKVKEFSKKIGFPVVLDTAEVEKTLTYSLLKEGIPALAIELGESDVVNEKDVEHAFNAIWGLLSELGIVKSSEEPSKVIISEKVKNKILAYSQQQVSLTSGVIRFLVKPGEIVNKGQPLARIYNPFGKLMETVRALEEGIVLGYADSSVAFPGSPVMAFGNI